MDIADILPRSPARRLHVTAGPWVPPSERPPGTVALLLIGGLLFRELELAGRTHAELLGPGDVFDPWSDAAGPLPVEASYSVLEASQLAVLNADSLAPAAETPVAVATLVEHLTCQAERRRIMIALAQLPRIEQRLLGLMWHLADRWGRVTSSGVVLPLKVTHETLGRMAGARRSTVSLALTELAATGQLHRNALGQWVLAPQSIEALAALDPDAAPPTAMTA